MDHRFFCFPESEYPVVRFLRLSGRFQAPLWSAVCGRTQPVLRVRLQVCFLLSSSLQYREQVLAHWRLARLSGCKLCFISVAEVIKASKPQANFTTAIDRSTDYGIVVSFIQQHLGRILKPWLNCLFETLALISIHIDSGQVEQPIVFDALAEPERPSGQVPFFQMARDMIAAPT